jgi:hypothetical protein
MGVAGGVVSTREIKTYAIGSKLTVLRHIVRNHFRLQRAPRRTLLFLLHLFPLYHLACWLWIKAGGGSEALVRRGWLFGALRLLTPEDKNAFAARVLGARPSPRALDALVRDGAARLDERIDASTVRAVLDYFRRQRGYRAQVPMQSDGVLRSFSDELARPQSRYMSFTPAVSLACPPVASLVTDARFAAIAEEYLGFRSSLFSVNTYATLTGTADHYVMRWHRDPDDFRALAFFVTWTPATASDGATVYVPGSHVSATVGVEHATHLEGEAGTVYAIDTFGLHAGNRRVDDMRLVTWFRYGRIPNTTAFQDGWQQVQDIAAFARARGLSG